jgi:hypothetical protein
MRASGCSRAASSREAAEGAAMAIEARLGMRGDGLGVVPSPGAKAGERETNGRKTYQRRGAVVRGVAGSATRR